MHPSFMFYDLSQHDCYKCRITVPSHNDMSLLILEELSLLKVADCCLRSLSGP